MLRSLERAVERGEDRRACAVAHWLALDAEQAGELHLALERYALAARHARACAWTSAQVEAELRAAQLLQRDGGADGRLIEHLERATEALGDESGLVPAAAWGALAVARLEAGDVQAAVGAFGRALACLPVADRQGVRARCLLGYGAALAAHGRWEEARAALEEGLALDASGPAVLTEDARLLAREHLARWTIEAGLVEQGRATLVALRSEVDAPPERLRLLTFEASLPTPEQARLEILRELAQLAPDQGAQATALHAWLELARAGQEGAAAAALELAVAMGRDDVARPLRLRAAEAALAEAGSPSNLRLEKVAEAERWFGQAGETAGVVRCRRLRFLASVERRDLAAVAASDPDAFEATAQERLHIVRALLELERPAEAVALAGALLRQEGLSGEVRGVLELVVGAPTRAVVG